MRILKPCDIENELRLALTGYFNVYCRPLPASYSLPNVLITATGGTTGNTIDTFAVTIDVRSETDAEAFETMSNVLGVLEVQAQAQTGALRNIVINNLARWGNDPARPDLKLCTASILVTAHRESFEITES